jgi:NAD(P)-dependent dehydrogenase (short-subunit alcohol dehydrogenase family)
MADDRIALVSGGAEGLGRAITDRLLAAGAQVAVCGRSQPDELPAGARFFQADVREAEEVDDLVAALVDHHGRLDVVVTEPGGSPTAAAATASPTFSIAILTLNLLAPLHLATAANRVMQDQEDGGAIVTIGALGGVHPAPGRAAFGAAKAGLIHLTSSLAAEWGPKVRLNAVSAAMPAEDGDPADPAASPFGRTATAAEVADAVAYLASPASAYVTGTNLVVHGGGERPAFLAALAGDGA